MLNESSSRLNDVYKADNGLRLSVFYNKLYHEFDMPPHAHNRLELLCIEQGSCNMDIYIGDEVRTIKLKEYESIIVNANVSHRMYINSISGCKVYNLEFSTLKTKQSQKQFSLSYLSSVCPSLKEFIEDFGEYVHLRESKDIIYTSKDILSLAIQVQNDDTHYMQNLLIHRLFIQIALDYKTDVKLSGTKYTKQALTYIHNNFDYDIKIKDIADELFIHPSYLEELFKKQIGKTPVEYINTIRVSKAKKILLNSDTPSIDVGFMVGFNTRQHFARTFKAMTGVSPADFRKSEKSRTYQSWGEADDSIKNIYNKEKKG